MVSIIAHNISLSFPLVGSDSRFGRRLGKATAVPGADIGGRIILKNGTPSSVLAVDNFSVELKPGDRLGIFGHNGAGKSTLLRIFGGIYPPTSGDLKISGRVSAMFSLNLGINKEATGLENIRLKGLMYGLEPDEIEELIPEITEFSELGDFLNLPMKTYSSGMVMRLMFSTASALRPDILLLDEWISAGDTAFRNKVDERLEVVLDQTPIVIIASHNEKRLRKWSNRFMRLSQGVAQIEDV